MTSGSQFFSDESKWQAVSTSDQSGDNKFFYAVRTTGIYCRPSCSSKTPNRCNVLFFKSSVEAENAGYRPCKKCTPDKPTSSEATKHIITAACRRIENCETHISLDDLAADSGLSPTYFHRIFKKHVGLTPKQYYKFLQSERFRNCLKSAPSVTDAIYSAGYSSSSRAYDKNSDRLGMSPSDYRRGSSGIKITYGIASCFLGLLIVALTERGVCAIEFGDDAEYLARQLQERFPKAVLQKADSSFTSLIQQVADFVASPESKCDIPLDIQGTVFQQKVWSILRQIEPGKTLSYTEVAERLGRPEAVRAVAAAIAANRLAVIIPCHRVISKTGKISGYRWGIERKKTLLEHEKIMDLSRGSK